MPKSVCVAEMQAPATQAVCAMLTGAGHQAWFVGGCVRDALLGIPLGDIDIATDARPEEVQRLARAVGLKPVPTGIDHGTITVVSGGIPHEVTTFRRDVETDGRRAVVAFAEHIEEDARRRDFTMNALYAAPDGRVVDPLGQGITDLAAGRLRFIEDPDQRIREDYLRILRFFRFHARFADREAGFDADTLAAIAANAEGLDGLSRERVGVEITRLLATADPAPAVATMAQLGILTRLLPGSGPRALGPLIHGEALAGLAPDWRCRLAAICAEDPSAALRLSKRDAALIAALREQAAGTASPAELGYRNGSLATQILVLRAALFEVPFDSATLPLAAQGAGQVFPITARDLMPRYSGAAIGAKLQALEAKWIDSGFALDRAALLRDDQGPE
ncbi:CCA tRNA nucleotidyltransferase [Pseudooceanicola algae]|nr:CCA tRNA nucleotidyltransferase [Pseudooceanicola algae]